MIDKKHITIDQLHQQLEYWPHRMGVGGLTLDNISGRVCDVVYDGVSVAISQHVRSVICAQVADEVIPAARRAKIIRQTQKAVDPALTQQYCTKDNAVKRMVDVTIRRQVDEVTDTVDMRDAVLRLMLIKAIEQEIEP
jgi:hypothetical protein